MEPSSTFRNSFWKTAALALILILSVALLPVAAFADDPGPLPSPPVSQPPSENDPINGPINTTNPTPPTVPPTSPALTAEQLQTQSQTKVRPLTSITPASNDLAATITPDKAQPTTATTPSLPAAEPSTANTQPHIVASMNSSGNHAKPAHYSAVYAATIAVSLAGAAAAVWHNSLFALAANAKKALLAGPAISRLSDKLSKRR